MARAPFVARLPFVVLCATLLLPCTTRAQPPAMPSADTARARMAPLKWLVGQWEGPATVTSGGRSFTLTQRETVLDAANGTVLMIQGRGSMTDAATVEREVFQAAGLLTYDVSARRFTWVSSGGSGHLGVTEAQVSGSSFVWTAKRGATTARYTIMQTPAGEWHEIGEESGDGVNWTRTIEMRLVKR